VDWPPSAFAGPREPVVVCVVGHDPFGVLLDRTVRNETINDRPVVVRRMRIAAPGAPCHIAFLGGSREQPAEAAAAIFAGSPVLTLSDDAAGSVVRFRVVNNRVRFEIDQRAAEADGMTISSKLLNLAVAVIR